MCVCVLCVFIHVVCVVGAGGGGGWGGRVFSFKLKMLTVGLPESDTVCLLDPSGPNKSWTSYWVINDCAQW